MDYSESMIEQCRKRFPACPPHVSFKVADAGSMAAFETGSFDFILSSRKGMDYVRRDDRLQILRELRRLGTPGACSCFSSHTVNWCVNLFEWRRLVSLSPASAAQTAKRLILRCIYNPCVRAAALRNAPHFVINYSLYRRKQPTYFIRPLAQLA